MVATTYVKGTGVPATQLNGDFSKAIDRGGDTMVGLLTLASNPVGPLDAVTKQYVDNLMSPTGPYILKSGDTMTGPLVLSGNLTHATKVGAMWGTYLGDSRPWFINSKWGFGWQATSTTDSVAGSGVLTVQRNATYTGSTGGNPAALVVNSVIGANVSGGESAIALLVNDSGSGGIHVGYQGTVNILTAGSASLFGGNSVSQDQTGRKSTVAGSLVGWEFDIIAAGPDDAATRINLDLIGREYPGGSTDGATTITVAGARTRGQTVRGGAVGVANTPSTSIYGFRTQTMADTNNTGQLMAFQNGFACDGASTAAFIASSAVQTLQTNASAIGGATTLTFATTNDRLCGYVWPGALVTGTNIAANTHVVSQTYNGTTQISVVLDTPTSGAVANGATITFTNAIGTAFSASGYIATAAFLSPGFSVSPTGAVNAVNYSAQGTKVVGARDTGWTAMTGTPDKSTAFATSTVTLAQLAGRVMQLQAALTTHGLIGA